MSSNPTFQEKLKAAINKADQFGVCRFDHNYISYTVRRGSSFDDLFGKWKEGKLPGIKIED